MSKTITVYSPAELKEANPAAFEKAHENYNYKNEEIPWQDEIMDSFKAIFKASGIYIRDWHMVSFDMGGEVRDLSGPRAMAWLENNLFADLRIKYTPYGRVDKEHHFKSVRAELSKYGSGYYAGKIKPCPFTGVCFDEDFIESLVKDIKAGESLGDAYENLASVAGRLFEQEIEYQNSEENFLEQDHLEFTIDGRMI